MIKKIKIRDMTEEQKNDFCWDKLDADGCLNCPFNGSLQNYTVGCMKSITKQDLLSDKFLNQEIEIETSDVLRQEEKEWLENLANGVDDRPTLVTISTRMRGTRQIIISFMHDSLSLPVKQDWFKGMEENRCYNMKELGL